MVINGIRPQPGHYLIKSLCCEPLKKCICIPLTAYPIYDIIALIKFIHHLINSSDIILQIRVHRNRHITVPLTRHKSSQQCILVSAVPAEVDAAVQWIGFMQFF